MNFLLQLRAFVHELYTIETDPLRRAGYVDGERRPRHRSHWANR